ncbi:MAG: glycosyltransferase, partial [Lachnospiraceae bacterium]|nr:glycosyltransferase [Candidatus Colinaster scatohippi]
MNILFFDMGSYTYNDIHSELIRKGHSVKTLYYHFKDRFEDEFFSYRLAKELNDNNYDLVFSVNFFPLIATECNRKNLPYVSWSYDSPLAERLTEYFEYSTNYIFLFDRNEVINYNTAGYDRIFHMPLAANTQRVSDALNQIPVNTYKSDISFVGTLYESDLDTLMLPVSDYVKGYVEALFQAQLPLYGCNILETAITPEIIEQINSSYRAIGQTSITLNSRGLAYAISKHITHTERSFLLNELSEYYNVNFYTTDNCKMANSLHIHGPVKYNTEMNAVFRDSTLNLCPTLRSIVSGIPLRSLDILAAGGTLFSNFQPELAEYFTDGESVIMYESIEDAFAKADYYIAHPDECKQIAINGAQIVKEAFNYSD